MSYGPRGARAFRRRPARARGSVLLELEQRLVLGAVNELDVEQPALARPRLLGLPVVLVLARAGVVGQRAAAGGLSPFQLRERRVRVAGDLLRGREARSHDAQPLIAVEAELDRDGLAGLHAVEGRDVRHRREE